MFKENVVKSLEILRQLVTKKMSDERRKTLGMRLEKAIEDVKNASVISGIESVNAMGKVAPEVKITKVGKTVVAVHKKGAVEIMG